MHLRASDRARRRQVGRVLMSAQLPFDPPPSLGTPAQPVFPPVPFLVIAGVALTLSAALLLAGPFADVAHVFGWVLASIVAITAVARFTAEDLKRRQRPNYSPRQLTGRVRSGMAVGALVLSGVHAWTLGWSLAAR
jgi:hypothetical protein